MDTDVIKAATKNTLLGFGRANGSGLAAPLEAAACDADCVKRDEPEVPTSEWY